MLNHGTLDVVAVSSVRLRYRGVLIQDTNIYTGIPYNIYVIIWKIMEWSIQDATGYRRYAIH